MSNSQSSPGTEPPTPPTKPPTEASAPTPPLHPACEPLAALLGVWQGRGRGDYPTIEPFEYFEEISFAHIGKPVFIYSQKTRDAQTNQPLHGESGYWRPVAPGSLEVVLAHVTGVTEITEGSFSHPGADPSGGATNGAAHGHLRIELASTAIGLTSTAQQVAQLKRVFVLQPGSDTEPAKLNYTLDMAAVDQPLQFHLEAELKRAG